jgi:hypothetical protein
MVMMVMSRNSRISASPYSLTASSASDTDPLSYREHSNSDVELSVMALIECDELSLTRMVLIKHREEEVSLRMIVSSRLRLSPLDSTDDGDANAGRSRRIIAFRRRSCGPVDIRA